MTAPPPIKLETKVPRLLAGAMFLLIDVSVGERLLSNIGALLAVKAANAVGIPKPAPKLLSDTSISDRFPFACGGPKVIPSKLVPSGKEDKSRTKVFLTAVTPVPGRGSKPEEISVAPSRDN